MEELDLLDRKILHELDKDSRQHFSTLAKAVRTNKDTLKYRIKYLTDEGYIEGYYAVIDYSKLDRISFRCYFKLTDSSPQQNESLIKYLSNHPQIAIFYRITGHYDFSFSVWAHDVWDFERFWKKFVTQFGSILHHYHVAIKTEYTEFSRNYLLDKPTEKYAFRVFQYSKPESLDSLDYTLLSALSKDARISLVDLAVLCKTSVVTVRARLQQLLKKKVIVGFRTKLNLEKLGRTYYKVDLWFSKFDKEKEFRQKVLSHPSVIFTENTVLTSDFEFDLEVKNFNEFIHIMDSFEAAFPGHVRKYEYYTLIKNYKTNYLPSP